MLKTKTEKVNPIGGANVTHDVFLEMHPSATLSDLVTFRSPRSPRGCQRAPRRGSFFVELAPTLDVYD